MKRIAVISICASALLALLTGCASEFQRESVLDARAEDPEGLISGILRKAKKYVLQQGASIQPSLIFPFTGRCATAATSLRF